jgi:dCTP deaminase
VILSTDAIKKLVHDTEGDEKDRLSISPVLDWSRQAKSGQCAIDVRLGQKFVIPRRTKLDVLDHISEDHPVNVRRYKDEHYVLLGDYFVLHPRQFVLGETLEWVNLPRGYAAYVIGRSSWGRDGLIIATATGVHSGFSGVLTLEITNLGEIPVRLYPGLTIAQLFIHTVQPGFSDSPCPSSFAGATGPTSGDAAGDDKKIIRLLGKRWGHPVEKQREIPR